MDTVWYSEPPRHDVGVEVRPTSQVEMALEMVRPQLD
jgi:hypothetical protein